MADLLYYVCFGLSNRDDREDDWDHDDLVYCLFMCQFWYIGHWTVSFALAFFYFPNNRGKSTIHNIIRKYIINIY